MAIQTQESLSGFIATDPQLSFNSKGEARFYVRIAQEHFERNPDGSFTQGETTFHGLVMCRRTAERAFQMFAKGDAFVAEGYVRSFTFERDGQTLAGEEFVAKRLGHDSARTAYAVDREQRRIQAVEPPAPVPAAQPVRPMSL